MEGSKQEWKGNDGSLGLCFYMEEVEGLKLSGAGKGLEEVKVQWLFRLGCLFSQVCFKYECSYSRFEGKAVGESSSNGCGVMEHCVVLCCR